MGKNEACSEKQVAEVEVLQDQWQSSI